MDHATQERQDFIQAKIRRIRFRTIEGDLLSDEQVSSTDLLEVLTRDTRLFRAKMYLHNNGIKPKVGGKKDFSSLDPMRRAA